MNSENNNEVTAVRCWAGSCSVEQYFLIRSKFFSEHPTAEILDEIRTLTVEKTKPQLLPFATQAPAMNVQVQSTQVHFAVWYMEKLSASETIKTN